MSLTSYRAAPPRVTKCVSLSLQEALFLQMQKAARGGPCRQKADHRKEKIENMRLADLAATYSPVS